MTPLWRNIEFVSNSCRHTHQSLPIPPMAKIASAWLALLFVLATLTQPTDNSTLRLVVPISSLGLTAGNPRFKYSMSYFGIDGVGRQMPGVGAFNAITPALNFSAAAAVAPGGSASATVTVNATELAASPALGVMVLAPDNVSGAAQAVLIPLN